MADGNLENGAQGKHRQSLASAFRVAFRGIGYALLYERNMRIHCFFAVVALVLGFVLGIDRFEWLAIIVCIELVMALEALNSAIESVVDLVSPEWSELARRAKDCAAGAVLLGAIMSVAIACVVFLPHVFSLLA